LVRFFLFHYIYIFGVAVIGWSVISHSNLKILCTFSFIFIRLVSIFLEKMIYENTNLHKIYNHFKDNQHFQHLKQAKAIKQVKTNAIYISNWLTFAFKLHLSLCLWNREYNYSEDILKWSNQL
jgi:UDP-N-acetylmuramyl pentapeptide phosphotransferase/UDP-N-acetylglucosamine-1-phosphate transferase